MRIILAFDIERTGSTTDYDTIAIGAVVIDETYKEIDRYYCNCYFPNETKFEEKCYIEFWSKNLDILKSFEYVGTKTKKEREYEMIKGFQDFRLKYEEYAKNNGYEYYLCSDNNVYDGHFVNELIIKYLDALPIPYSASTQSYETFFETHSMQKGLLLANGINKDWSLTNEIKKIYDIPECEISHNHNPADDAYTIAHSMNVLLEIGSQKIKRK